MHKPCETPSVFLNALFGLLTLHLLSLILLECRILLLRQHLLLKLHKRSQHNPQGVSIFWADLWWSGLP